MFLTRQKLDESITPFFRRSDGHYILPVPFNPSVVQSLDWTLRDTNRLEVSVKRYNQAPFIQDYILPVEWAQKLDVLELRSARAFRPAGLYESSLRFDRIEGEAEGQSDNSSGVIQSLVNSVRTGWDQFVGGGTGYVSDGSREWSLSDTVRTTAAALAIASTTVSFCPEAIASSGVTENITADEPSAPTIRNLQNGPTVHEHGDVDEQRIFTLIDIADIPSDVQLHLYPDEGPNDIGEDANGRYNEKEGGNHSGRMDIYNLKERSNRGVTRTLLHEKKHAQQFEDRSFKEVKSQLQGKSYSERELEQEAFQHAREQIEQVDDHPMISETQNKRRLEYNERLDRMMTSMPEPEESEPGGPSM